MCVGLVNFRRNLLRIAYCNIQSKTDLFITSFGITSSFHGQLSSNKVQVSFAAPRMR